MCPAKRLPLQTPLLLGRRAWDPGLASEVLVGTPRLPRKLFLKWTELAGICLLPYPLHPFLAWNMDTMPVGQESPYDRKNKSQCFGVR